MTVEPKLGGAGVIAINAMKGAPPTGNDLVVADVGNLSINPLIFPKLAYNPETDLVPVALLFGFVASPGPAQQVADLMSSDRARYAEVLKRVKVSVD